MIELVDTVHVTDMSQRGQFTPTVIGTGMTPNREAFRYLKEHGFDKWLCIEEASGRGLEGVRDAYHYVKKLWEEV